MNLSKRKAGHYVILSLIILVSQGHYLMPVSLHQWHSVFQRLYYIPIVLACYHFGMRSGVAYALFCAICYFPHILFQWAFDAEQRFTQYIEISMFFMVAALVGWLFDYRKKQQETLVIQQEKLRRTERLALTGQLAAGLAHEIRNPLNSLLGSVDILKQSLGPQHPKIEFAEILDIELRRVNRILNQFLDFAKPKEPERIPHDFPGLVNEALIVMQKTLDQAGVTVNKEFGKEMGKDLPHILVDAEWIKQILINLILNAIDAMPTGGSLLIHLSEETGFLKCLIQDSGIGIPDAQSKELFTPFFTTKTSGTGLGLASSQQIAEKHGGSLNWVPSLRGACFELRLPTLYQE